MYRFGSLLMAAFLCFMCMQCRQNTVADAPAPDSDKLEQSLLHDYVHAKDEAYSYELKGTIPGEGFSTHVIRLVSQEWLSTAEVKDPVWWHWLTLTIPDGATSNKAMVIVGGGNRSREQPAEADQMSVQIALATQSMVASLHNVPNQPVEFVNDDYGPRVEDELIAYGWRRFLEGGGQLKDAEWLARFPMTKSVVRSMDALQAYTAGQESLPGLEKFVVTGGSKRGWTTWTTGAVDDRVIAIAPIVIDMLNVVPSFEHHWRVYGFWAPAVGNYVEEGIMEWQHSREYKQLLDLTEPFEFRDQLELPKLILNSTGDQFFLPDSWQFYWDDLLGEKHMRYVPNTDHSMRDSDVLLTLISFYQFILEGEERPTFQWKATRDGIAIETNSKDIPQQITLWQAHSLGSRDFRIETQGKLYEPTDVTLRADGKYNITVEAPNEGYTAYYVEVTFPGVADIPFKQSTGIVVTPDIYPHDSYISPNPQGKSILQ